jgi:hypothetical protein
MRLAYKCIYSYIGRRDTRLIPDGLAVDRKPTGTNRAVGTVIPQMMMEHLMQNEQADKEHVSGWWHWAWTAVLNFAEAIETSPTEYMLDRISYLESEVASLKSELQSRAQARE